MPAKKQREEILLRLEPDLLERIKAFRFDHRFESRQEAIVWLLKYALANLPKSKQLPKL